MAARAQLEQMRRGLPPGAARPSSPTAGSAGAPASTSSPPRLGCHVAVGTLAPWPSAMTTGDAAVGAARRRRTSRAAQLAARVRRPARRLAAAPALGVPGLAGHQAALPPLGARPAVDQHHAWASSPRPWASSTGRCSTSRSRRSCRTSPPGLLIWNFINGCILEGSEVFIANEGLIRFLPAPLSAARVPAGVAPDAVLRAQPGHLGAAGDHLPAAAALVVAARDPGVRGCWRSTGRGSRVLAGIVATRFRDIPPIIASLTQLLFFMTPIVWSYERLRSNPPARAVRRAESRDALRRDPPCSRCSASRSCARHWIVVGVITVVGCGAALVCLRNYRARVAYWV